MKKYIGYIIALGIGVVLGFCVFPSSPSKVNTVTKWRSDTIRYETKIYDTITITKWKVKKVLLPSDTVFLNLDNNALKEIARRYYTVNYLDSTLNFDGATLNFSGETYKNELQNTKFELQFTQQQTSVTNTSKNITRVNGLFLGIGAGFGNESQFYIKGDFVHRNFIYSGGYDLINKGYFVGVGYRIF